MKGKIAGGLLLLYMLLGLFLFMGPAEARYIDRCVLALPEVSVKVKTLPIHLPEMQDTFVYDGTVLRPVDSLPEGIRALGSAEASDAGTYELILQLTDPEGSTWEDGTTEDRIVTWQILPRPVSKPHLEKTICIYSGGAQTPGVTGVHTEPGQSEDLYVGLSGTMQASGVGVYPVTFSLKDPRNTRWEDGGTDAYTESWGIYVCHIGGEYFTLVRAAFDTNRSTSEQPIILDCSWTESPINVGGTDFFNLNQKTLTGSVENRGALTVYGGKVKQTSAGDAYALRNSGTLTVTGGTYEAVCTASATSGKESWAVYNTAGTANLTNCTLNASGTNTAVCGYQISGGTVTSAAVVNVSSNASTHGAYYAYVSGGTLNVNGGSSSVQNTAGFTYLFQAAGGMLNVTAGTHSGTAAKNGNGFLCTSGTVKAAGGNTTVTAKTDCNAVNASGGTVSVTSGTHTAMSSGGKEARGLFRSNGQLTMTGGVVRAGTSGTGYGAANTTADTSATKMQVTGGQLYVRAGTAYCVMGGVQNAWIKLSSNARFYIYYRSAHSCGSYYTGSAPYHNALTTTGIFTFALLRYDDEMEFCVFEVENGILRLGGSSSGQETILLENVKCGKWTAVLRAEDGESIGVQLEAAEEPLSAGELPAAKESLSAEKQDLTEKQDFSEKLQLSEALSVFSVLGRLPESEFSYDVVCGFPVPADIETGGYAGVMVPLAGAQQPEVEVERNPNGEITAVFVHMRLSEGAYYGAFYEAERSYVENTPGAEDDPFLYAFPEEEDDSNAQIR